MKPLKLLYLSAPVATCIFYSLDVHKENIPMTYSILQAAEQEMKLEQVQIIFRHGARTPTSWTKKRFLHFSNIEPETWDKDKLLKMLPGTDIDYTVKLEDGSDPSGITYDEHFGEEMEGGCRNGQLTNVGQQLLYDVGTWLSKEYVDQGFISPSYKKNEVYVRSTYYRRTIQSAVCLLAGLYGKDTITEPVNIETKKMEMEDMCPNAIGCANFLKWFKYSMSQEARKPEEREAENFINMLMGKNNNKNNVHLTHVNDLIRCRQAHGLNVPQYLLDNREVINKYELKLMLELFGKGSVDRIKTGIGSFLETICCRINEAIEGSSQSKMLLYSAHDWTILSVLIAFGVDIKEWPEFASHLILELYKREDGKRFIRVRLNGKPIMFDSETDEDYLPVERFLNSIEVYRVLDFDKACGNAPRSPAKV